MARRRKTRKGKFQACIGRKLKGKKFANRAVARKAWNSAVAACK